MIPLEQTLCADLWKKIGIHPHHGIAVPLFSLHTKESGGIGEFLDLIPLIKWCASLGFDVIQLLPLNDTGHTTSPYSAITAFGLNPIHISLKGLPHSELCSDLTSDLLKLQKLNTTQRIDYKKVYKGKEAFLRAYYKKVSHLMTSTEEYTSFLEENKWLNEYALFKTLKVKNNYKSWEEWEENERHLEKEVRLSLEKTHEKEIEYHIFLQYIAFSQMKRVKKEADHYGVLLKGDIPILIGRDSADIWFHKNLFLMEYDAGSPPDTLFKEGQNWSFPVYNWQEHKKDHFKWWKERLKVAQNFYHIYRLDHIVGFYRIFAIPKGETAKNGFFLPKDKNEWVPQGKEILEALLKNCDMFPIGEDLPPDGQAAISLSLKSFGICIMAIMRWQKYEDGEFIDPKSYDPLTMVTVSTHDHDTLSMWWENHPEEAKKFCHFMKWNYTYELSKEHLRQILSLSHKAASLFHVNLLNEYLKLIPHFTWENPKDERINVPGTISDKNWTYRFRPSIEEIEENESLKLEIKQLLS
jgi:4-alpha-glucanotransferase